MTTGTLPASFSETLRKSPATGGWFYLVWPQSAAFFGTRARVKVRGTMDGQPFESSFMPLGDGNHKLPVRAELLALLHKSEGETIDVRIEQRLA